MKKRVLYAGDSHVGGAANYLLAILTSLEISFRHVPPSEELNPGRFDALILSDFPKNHLSARAEKNVVAQVRGGAGLLMVGGWGSFSGPFGGWSGTQVEQLLPVRCLDRDDRLNFPGGALIRKERPHPMFTGLSFSNPPVICGINRVRVKPSGRLVLSAEKISTGVRHPLLVVGSEPAMRVAALTTDLAPHWCGGMVDWGRKSEKLPVNSRISVEVGDAYIRFVSSLVRWISRAHG